MDFSRRNIDKTNRNSSTNNRNISRSSGITIIQSPGSSSLSEARKEFLSKKGDDNAEGIINFRKGLKVLGNLINNILTSSSDGAITDEAIMTAKRVMKEVGELSGRFLRKDQDDTTNFIITFLKGLAIGQNGSSIKVLEDGTSEAVVDRLYVKIKAYFEELEVQRKTYVGGAQILTPSGMKCIKVEETEDAYRCYIKAEQEGQEIINTFSVGTLAYMKECNIKVGVSHHAGNRYFWREVTSVGPDYIDVSKTICDPDSENDAPYVGDDIIGLGHRSDIGRQAAIALSSVDDGAPSIIFYQGINDFTLVGKEVIEMKYDKATGHAKLNVFGDAYIGDKDKNSYIEHTIDHGVKVKGIVDVAPGSKGAANLEDLPSEISKAVQIGSENLLMNTSFLGDFEPIDLTSETPLHYNTDLYSDQFAYWDGEGNVIQEKESYYGFAISLGSISQPILLIPSEVYVVSYKAKGGSISIECGGNTITQQLTSEYKKYSHVFTNSNGTTFTMSGSCTVCDIKLEHGTISTDWCPSSKDPDQVKEAFHHLFYLRDALQGDTKIMGGLVLTSMIQAGMYKDGRMEKVTAGMSGIYNDDTDVAFWAGGTFEQAIKTVQKLINGENPTDAEWRTMAKFVATHGGDAFFRGYIYAQGGYFRGQADISQGSFAGQVTATRGSTWTGKMATETFGKRIEMDPSGCNLRMYNFANQICAELKFEQGDIPSVTLYQYADNKVLLSETFITSNKFHSSTYRADGKVETERILEGANLTLKTHSYNDKGQDNVSSTTLGSGSVNTSTANLYSLWLSGSSGFTVLRSDGASIYPGGGKDTVYSKSEDVYVGDFDGKKKYLQFVNGFYIGTRLEDIPKQ